MIFYSTLSCRKAWDRLRGITPIDAQIMYIHALTDLLTEVIFLINLTNFHFYLQMKLVFREIS